MDERVSGKADRLVGGLGSAGRVGCLLFAWSLPCSFLGMQVGAILCLLCLAGKIALTRGRAFRSSPLDASICGLLGAFALSSLLAPGGWNGLHRAGGYWVVIGFFATRGFLDSPRMLRRAVVGTLVTACVASLFGIYQSLSHSYPFAGVIHPQMQELVRRAVPGLADRTAAVGFFYSRLSFAHVLLFPFCWAMALCLERGPWKPRVLYFLALGLIALGIYFTWTRGAFLAAALCVVLLSIWGLRISGLRKAVAVLAFSALALGAVLVEPGMRARVVNSFSGGRDWGRLAIWQTALHLTHEHPLTGVGYGNFSRDAVARIQEQVAAVGATRFSAYLDLAHGNAFSLMAETGLLGFLMFCWVCAAYFHRGFSVLGRIPDDEVFSRAFRRGALVSVMAFLVIGLAHDTFFHAEGAFAFWFTLAASGGPEA